MPFLIRVFFICSSSPSPFGRGRGEGIIEVGKLFIPTFCHNALTLTLSQRERGLFFALARTSLS